MAENYPPTRPYADSEMQRARTEAVNTVWQAQRKFDYQAEQVQQKNLLRWVYKYGQPNFGTRKAN